jgi:hypothetical protein
MLPHQATPVPFIAKPTVIGLGVIQVTKSLKSPESISSRWTYQDAPQRGHSLLGNPYVIFFGVPMRMEIKLSIVLTKAAFIKTTFHQETGHKFKEETIVQLFEHSFLWC